jgi:hypothetical protein
MGALRLAGFRRYIREAGSMIAIFVLVEYDAAWQRSL